MTDNVIVTHTKHDNIADWTQATVDAQIVAGNLPPGTLLADLVLPSDWNADHTIAGMTQLLANVRSYAIIDMGGGNYTMTDAESVAYFKLIVNEGVGSTLTWPTTSDGYCGITQTISTQFTSNPISLVSQTGGSGVTLGAGLRYISQILYSAGVSIVARIYLDAPYMRQGTNGVNVQSADYTATADDSGKLIVFSGVTAALTIQPVATTDYGANAVIYLTNEYSPTYCTVVAGAGVTINGGLKVAPNELLILQRDGDTDTWYSSAVINTSIDATDNNAAATTTYPVWVTAGGLPAPAGISSTKMSFIPNTGTLTTNIVKVDDDAYGAGWNGSLAVPTKNAIYDKIESGLTLGKSIGISSQYLALN